MASTTFEGGVPLAFRPRFGSERQSTSGLGVCCCGEPVRPPLPVPAGLGFLCRPRPRHALRHTVQTRESRTASQRQRQVRRSPLVQECALGVPLSPRRGTAFGSGGGPCAPRSSGPSGKGWLESWPWPARCRLGLRGALLAVGGGIMSHAFRKHFLKRGNTSLLEM